MPLSPRLAAIVDATARAALDLAFAARVGVLDGRHPAREAQALARIAAALARHGRLYVDGREVALR